MNADFFRKLSPREESEFRHWLYEHVDEIDPEQLELYHPVIRKALVNCAKAAIKAARIEMEAP